MRMKIKGYLYAAWVVALVCVAVAWYSRSQRRTSPVPPIQETNAIPHRVAVSAARNEPDENDKAVVVERPPVVVDDSSVFQTDEYNAATSKLDDLLDDEDYDALLVETKKLVQHPVAAVRSRVVLALHWAGLKGLDTLTAMLGDPDPDVAKEAFEYWKAAVSEITSDDAKAALLEAAYKVTGDHTDASMLEDILHEFVMFDNERVAAAYLIEMSKQVKNPEHEKMFIEAMDGFSQPDDDSTSLSKAVSNLNKWDREKAAEEAEEAKIEAEIQRGE